MSELSELFSVSRPTVYRTLFRKIAAKEHTPQTGDMFSNLVNPSSSKIIYCKLLFYRVRNNEIYSKALWNVITPEGN